MSDDGPPDPWPSAPHQVALAPNWRRVLAVDAVVGVAALVVGVIVALGASLVAGAGLALIGSVYVTMVAVRARRWARTRRDYGLAD
jgi:hypothetical protein